MTDQPGSLFQAWLDSEAALHARELERRSARWYDEVLEDLMWLTSASDLRSGLKSLGEIDTDELERALRERLFLAAEQGRQHEYALLSAVIDAVSRESAAFLPAPPSHDDVAVALRARASLMAQRVAMKTAGELFASGAFSNCVRNTRAVDDWLRAIPDDELGYYSNHDLVELELSAIDRRAEALFQLGAYDRAAAAYTTLLVRTDTAAGELVRWFSERRFRLAALAGLAAIARRREQPELAVELARRAVRLCAGWYGRADPPTLNNLGMALLANGQPHLAEEQFAAALELTGRPDASPFTTFGLADVARSTGGSELADTLYGAELAIGVSDRDWRRVGIYCDRVVSGLTSPQASELERLALAHNDLPASLAGTIGLRLALARVVGLATHGRHEEAVEIARAALRVGTAVEPASPSVLRLRLELAKVLRHAVSSGAAAATAAVAHEEVSVILDHADALAAETPLDDRRAEIYGEWADAFGLAIALELDVAESTSGAGGRTTAFALHDRGKASSFATTLRDTFSRTDEDPTARQLLARRSRLRRIVIDMQDSNEEIAGIDESSMATLDRLHMEIAALDAELTGARTDTPVGRTDADPIEIQAALSNACLETTAVVSFFCDLESVYCFVLRSDDPELFAHRAGISRTELMSLAADLQRQFNGSPSEGFPPILRTRPARRSIANWPSVEERLFPQSSILDGVGHIVFVPHGPLHALPLHAMRHGGNVLAADHSTSYLPNLTSLAMILRRPPVEREAHDPPTAIVAGVAAEADRHPEYFEADASLFGPEWRVSGATGVPATREAVLNDLNADVDVIHLSCHGVFVPSRIGRSGLLLSDGAVRPPSSDHALTPVRRRRHLLSFQDALSQDIRTRLVTLRACSSGLQRPRNRGDEFESLSRTLLASGARATLSALWNVDQQSSMTLLARFYRAWSQGGTTLAKALSIAQREMVSSSDSFLAHQYHWAPFALSGDWRQVCPNRPTSTDSNRGR